MSKEMTIEEKEKKLIEVFGEFPHRINIMLSRKDGEYSITYQKFKKDKIQLKNIKFDQLQIFSLDGSVFTPLKVVDVNNYAELEKEVEYLKQKWID